MNSSADSSSSRQTDPAEHKNRVQPEDKSALPDIASPQIDKAKRRATVIMNEILNEEPSQAPMLSPVVDNVDDEDQLSN